MAGVRLAGVTKRFEPSTTAVDALDLEVLDGELLVLLGPSGCGKSTALRLIAGLALQDSGTIHIGDRCVDNVPADKRDVAMVFQSYALYPHMTVRRNIEFSLRPLGTQKAEREEAVARVAAQLGLTDVLDRKPRQISGGQQQRVALGRALVRRPSVFLMDEPLSNLDAQLRVKTRSELVDLQHDIGTTMIYVTHDQVEALTMGHRIGVMGGGRLQQLGTPEEIYDRPANTFVAGFVGTPPMNLWTVAVDDAGRVTVGGELVAEADEPAVRERSVTLGVRPESVRLVSDGAEGIAAVVDWSEDLGHEHVIGGSLAGGGAFALRSPGVSGSPPERGTRVRVSPDPGALHWFDGGDGSRIT